MTGKGALEIRWKSPKYQRQHTQALASIKIGEKRKDPVERHGESGATCLGVGLLFIAKHMLLWDTLAGRLYRCLRTF